VVEHNLAKVGVAGSNPVVRSTKVQVRGPLRRASSLCQGRHYICTTSLGGVKYHEVIAEACTRTSTGRGCSGSTPAGIGWPAGRGGRPAASGARSGTRNGRWPPSSPRCPQPDRRARPGRSASSSITGSRRGRATGPRPSGRQLSSQKCIVRPLWSACSFSKGVDGSVVHCDRLASQICVKEDTQL
jgi:hypothetical protein